MRPADLAIDVVRHAALTPDDLDGLRRCFDDEYLDEFGPWDPEQPYGYAGHDIHVLARSSDGIVGHVGWGRRTIAVGDAELVIAGVGGVLVSPAARGSRLGRSLMAAAAASMRDEEGIDLGYLGCREEIVPFYASCGWHRIHAVERSISRAGRPVVEPAGPPLLVLPVRRAVASWPEGIVDLRGRAW